MNDNVNVKINFSRKRSQEGKEFEKNLFRKRGIRLTINRIIAQNPMIILWFIKPKKIKRSIKCANVYSFIEPELLA